MAMTNNFFSMSRETGLQWFDAGSSNDRKLIFADAGDELRGFEVSDPSQLARASAHAGATGELVVILQRENTPKGLRCQLDREKAATYGRQLSGGPTRTLALVFGLPESGAIAALTDSLGNSPLDSLLVAWAFTGDDIADCTGIEQELAHVVHSRGLARLALVTNNWRHDASLAQLLDANHTLTDFAAFAPDDEHRWPGLAAPAMQAVVERNRARRAAARAHASPGIERRNITCPRCTRPTTQLLYRYLDAEYPAAYAAARTGRVFEVDCESCGHRFRADFSTLYVDHTRGFCVALTTAHEIEATRTQLSAWARTLPEPSRLSCRLVLSRLRLAEAITVFEAGLHDGIVVFLEGMLQEHFPNQDVVFAGLSNNAEHGPELVFHGFRGNDTPLSAQNVSRTSYDGLLTKVGSKLAPGFARTHESWPTMHDGTFILGLLQ